MPRLFISHSSKDSIQALAFQRWLELKGWSKDDVFIDLHDMKAGERWRDTLVKANVACEALLFLASPEALGSEECQREVRRAEDDRKDVIVAILRDVSLDDSGLPDYYKDRQIMDLSLDPRDERVEVEHESRKHFVDFNGAALNAIHATLIERGIAPNSFAWPPKNKPDAAPYPGLDAFDEDSAGIFFGREADIMAGIRELRQIRHRGSPRLLVIQAASGAGKSSFLRAGLWPRLARTAEFAPLAIIRPAKGIITGEHGIGQGLAAWFTAHSAPRAAGTIYAELMDSDAAHAANRFAAYLGEAARIVANERAIGANENSPAPHVSPLIAIDQGEELFAAEDGAESARFLEMLGHVLAAPPPDLDPYILITIRADSVNELLQRVPGLGVTTPQTIMLPPLSTGAYRDVITKPAAVYSQQVKRFDIEPALVNALVKDASGADALPLLAFTLQRLFDDYSPEQEIRLEHYTAMGGMKAAISRKLKDAQRDAAGAGTDVNLKRLIVPGLATWDPVASAAKRVVANESQLVGDSRADLAPLVEALVRARLLTRGADTLEVAHEALLRRPPISNWLEYQKDALKLRDDVLREAEEWSLGGHHTEGLVRRGDRLQAAVDLAGTSDFSAAMAPAQEYLSASRQLESRGRRRARRTQAAIYTLMLGVIIALLGVVYKEPLDELRFEWTTHRAYIAEKIQPHVLTKQQELELKPAASFRECSKVCPEMVVVPSGTFRMGSPDDEAGREKDEGPLRTVQINRNFAVSKFEVTWNDWEQCVAMRGCDGRPTEDSSFGRGNKPVINVTWHQATAYAAWLSRVTGKPYRLLSEAEWEYAARAGGKTVYSFGNDVSQICHHVNLADQTYTRMGHTGRAAPCNDSHAHSAQVGSYPANAFGLYDMHGNVYEWVEDCYVDSYEAAPTDGSAVKSSDCSRRVLRGGSWFNDPLNLRSASRIAYSPDDRYNNFGFRVGRTLTP